MLTDLIHLFDFDDGVDSLLYNMPIVNEIALDVDCSQVELNGYLSFAVNLLIQPGFCR